MVEMPDCKDLVLAPEFDLERKLLALEVIHRFSYSLGKRVPDLKNSATKRVNEHAVNSVNESGKHGEDMVYDREYSQASENIPPTFTPAEEVQVLLAYAEMLKSGKPVTRTGIRDHLGWNNKQYERVIKPVCDKHKIA